MILFSIEAMADEIEKIGQNQGAQKPNMAQRLGTGAVAVGAGLGARQVAGIGAGVLGQSLTQGEMRQALRGAGTTAEQAGKLRDIISPGTHVSHLPEGRAMQAVYIPKTKSKAMQQMTGAALKQTGISPDVIREGLQRGSAVVPAAAGPHVAAHELGHAAFRGGRVGKAVSALRMPGGLVSGLAAPGMALFSDPDSRASKAAPWVGAAGMAPLLADEAYASIKGYKGLKRMGASPESLRTARRQLGKAFGTYGLTAAGLVGTPLAIRAVKKHYKRKRERKAAERSK